MKFINELLGFVTLTSPLWLIIIIVLLGAVFAIIFSKLFKTNGMKLNINVSIFILIILILFGDEIVGSIYFKYLCNTKAGIKVYHKVKLPTDYWDEQGRPKFYSVKNGNFKLKGYSIEYKIGKYSPVFHIENAGYRRIDKQSGQVLGEVINFMYWGGWVKRNLNFNNTGSICEGNAERSNSLINKIFVPRNP